MKSCCGTVLKPAVPGAVDESRMIRFFDCIRDLEYEV